MMYNLITSATSESSCLHHLVANLELSGIFFIIRSRCGSYYLLRLVCTIGSYDNCWRGRQRVSGGGAVAVAGKERRIGNDGRLFDVLGVRMVECKNISARGE